MVRFSNERSGSARDRRAEARRLEILRAAARTFRRRGFAGAGIREIAAEADLSPGNLYHYFKGKHEILYFCQDRWLDAMLRELQSARLSRKPLPEQLARVLGSHLRCLLDELEGAAAHLEVEVLPPKLRRAVVDKRDRYERGIRRLVAAGVERGDFAPCDPVLVTRAILGALNWTARWYRPEGSSSSRDVADSLVGYLMRGLSARRAARAASRPDVRGGGVRT